MAEIITVTPETVGKTGFFCKMSARGKPGYEQKLDWLAKRFEEGLQLRLLGSGERGFIEFIPGDFAWRGIENAHDFMVIHCLWVVGRSKGKGLSTALLTEAETYAKNAGYKGIAAVASTGNWLIDPGVLTHHGYLGVASEAPGFEILAKAFDTEASMPRFSGGFDNKAMAHPDGLAIYRSSQCPYLDDAARTARSFAEDEGLACTEIVLETAEDVRRLSPTPYGVFAITLNGQLVSSHYLLAKQLKKAVA